jgi:hypothetical protein
VYEKVLCKTPKNERKGREKLLIIYARSMINLLAHAQKLVYTLIHLMPSSYQQQSLQALLGLFLEAQGYPLPEHCQSKSASALSRFLNQYNWSTRAIIRTTRKTILERILAARLKGRRPILQVILDLTTLEKTGKFKALEGKVRVYHGKRGLHIVVLYLVLGNWRVPWSWRVYRGKDTPSPTQLGLRLLKTLPSSLTEHFQVLVLADSAFGSINFLEGVRQMKYHAVVGIRCDRKLTDGRSVRQLTSRGQQVQLVGLSFSVWLSWVWLKREGGKREQRFVISTRPMKGTTITRWGKRRWQIEGWFKTAKYRFGLHRFGQATQLGVYRWLLLSAIAYLLAHWSYLSTGSVALPNWGESAQLALDRLLPQLVILLFFKELERVTPLLCQQGWDVQIIRCKI